MKRLSGHRVALIEGGYVEPGNEPMPHYYVIRCECGWESKTYHGETAARELAERHLFVKLHEIQITPGGQMLDADRVVMYEARLAAQRRLIRWLSLAYGENEPIFHGPDRETLLGTYREALLEDDGDPAFFVAAERATQRPPPAPPVDYGDQYVEMVSIDSKGNTIHEQQSR